MYQLWFSGGGSNTATHRGTETLQEAVIAVSLQVWVTGRDAARTKVLDDARIGERVEITAHDDRDPGHPWDGGLESDPPLALSSHDDGVEFIREHQSLDQFHVGKLRVPVDMGVGYEDVLTWHVHAAGVLDLQQSGDANVVLEHDTIEHCIGALGVRHG